MCRKRARAPWAAALCSAPGLGAALALAVNDHWLKGAGALPPWLTGKLSDVAGLFLFPLLLVAAARGLMAAAGRDAPAQGGWLGLSAAALTGVTFSAVKVWGAAHAALVPEWAWVVMDPTDLWALAALPASVGWMRRSDATAQAATLAPSAYALAMAQRRWSLWAVCAAALASAATSPPDGYRNYPLWHLKATPAAATTPAWDKDPTVYVWRFQAGEVAGAAWVSKSGRDGLGVSVSLTRAAWPGEAPLPARVLGARARVGGLTVAAAALPAGWLYQRTTLYVPLPFDNLTAWNAGAREGALCLALVVGWAPARRCVAMSQRLDGRVFYRHQMGHPWSHQ